VIMLVAITIFIQKSFRLVQVCKLYRSEFLLFIGLLLIFFPIFYPIAKIHFLF